MRVEEVKTSFIADTQKYIKDIQKAQKVLNTFLNTNDMTKKEKAENRLQVAIQKRAQAQAKALTQELKLKRQVDATNSKLASSQNNVNKSISKSSSSSKMFAGELAHIARNVMTLYYSVKSLGKVLTTGIDFNRTKEDARLAFSVMFRSADVATQKIKELQEYAIASPLSFKETISASKQLSAYGFGANELVPAMEMLGTVAKATGHSLDDISYVYGTLRTQGRAYSRDLMQFSMRGIPIYEELAEVMGVNQKEIKKLTEDGKVGFKEVEKAFKNMTKEGGKFGGLLDEYMKGFSGIASQFSDTMEVLLGDATKSIFGVLKTVMADTMNTLDTSAIQGVFEDLGITLAVDLRETMNVLVPLLETVLKMTPALIAFFKAWLMYVVISKAMIAMKAIPKVLRLIKIEAAHAAVSLRAMSASSWVVGLKTSLAMALGAIKTFSNTVKLLIASNPLLAAIAGILAIGSAITITILHKNAEKIERERTKIKERAGVGSELLKYDIGTSGDFLEAGNLVHGIDYVENYVSQSVRLTYEGIDRIAKAYGISMSEAARIVDELFTSKKMPDVITDNLQSQIRDMETRTGAMKNFNAILAENIQLQQQEYLNQKLGRQSGSKDFALTDGVRKTVTGYFGFGNVKTQDVYNTAGGRAGTEYVKGILGGLSSKETELRRTYANLYNPDMMQDNIKAAIEEVESTLTESAKVPMLFEETTWDEQLRALLEKLRSQLEKDGKGKKAVEIKLDPWFDREKMASATKMIFDDLELQRDKDFATAQEKLDKQEISFEQYSRAINAIHSKYLDDRTEAEKEAAEKTMNLWREGSEDVWRNLSIDAHKELFAFLEDARTIKNFWSSFIDGAKKAKSTVVSAFGHIKDLWDSFENPFSISSSSSPVGVKIDIDKDALKNNMGNMWDKMVIFGNYIRDGFTVFKSNISLFKDGVKKFVEGVIIIGKNVGLEMIKGTQIGNIISGASQYKNDFIQQKRDEWIASGRDAGAFDADFAMAEGTSMGTFNMAGNIQGGIITQAIMAFAEMALSVDEVNKVLDPFGTMMEAAGTFLKPLLSVGFSGIASVLKEIGEVLGKVLLPILMPLMLSFQIVAGILKMTVIPILQTVGAGFAWLYDDVMVPFGNFVIDAINEVIGIINMIPGINIEKLRKFKTTAEMLADSTESVNNTMQYMVKKLNDLIDKEIATLGDLYDVGAISGAEYARQVDDANMRRLSLEENMVNINVAQLESIDEIHAWLVKNGAYPDIEALLAAEKLGVELPEGFYNPEDISTYATQTDTPSLDDVATQTGKQWENAKYLADSWGDKAGVIGTAAGAFVGGAADVSIAIGTGVADLASKIGNGIASFFGFADGTSNIPYDMVANVHKGEGIVPATFMDSIRAGELTLSGNSGTSSGSITNYYITVEGSVTSENDLADALANIMATRAGRGYQ